MPFAAARDLMVGVGPLVIGLVIVVALIVAVGYGTRLRRRGDLRPSEPPPPARHRAGDRHRDAPVPTPTPRGDGRRGPHDLTAQNTPADPAREAAEAAEAAEAPGAAETTETDGPARGDRRDGGAAPPG